MDRRSFMRLLGAAPIVGGLVSLIGPEALAKAKPVILTADFLDFPRTYRVKMPGMKVEEATEFEPPPPG